MLSLVERQELNGITEKIIGCAYKVGGELGFGFLEKVYENALAYEMGKASLKVQRQIKLEVKYKNIIDEKQFLKNCSIMDVGLSLATHPLRFKGVWGRSG